MGAARTLWSGCKCALDFEERQLLFSFGIVVIQRFRPASQYPHFVRPIGRHMYACPARSVLTFWVVRERVAADGCKCARRTRAHITNAGPALKGTKGHITRCHCILNPFPPLPSSLSVHLRRLCSTHTSAWLPAFGWLGSRSPVHICRRSSTAPCSRQRHCCRGHQ